MRVTYTKYDKVVWTELREDGGAVICMVRGRVSEKKMIADYERRQKNIKEGC